MKIHILLICAMVVVCSCTHKAENNQEITPTANNIEKTTEQLRHVVLFKFKEIATPTDIEKVEAAFITLPSKIKEIKDFEWGLNNSIEGLDKGFTHCFFVTFNSEEDRALYLPHPAHMAFVEVLEPYLEDVLVLDYWTK